MAQGYQQFIDGSIQGFEYQGLDLSLIHIYSGVAGRKGLLNRRCPSAAAAGLVAEKNSAGCILQRKDVYKRQGLLIAAAAGLLLSVAAIWILSRKKREIK